MTVLLTLVAHGATAATKRAAFPADEPLKEGAVAQRHRAPWGARRALTSPRQACLETAGRLLLTALPDDDLADMDYGRWSGLDLAKVASAEPAAVQSWIADPEFRGHGGESRVALSLRVTAWLDRVAGAGEHLVAVTHPAVIKSVVLHVLGARPEAFWQIDIAPATATDLRHDGRRWTLSKVSCPIPD